MSSTPSSSIFRRASDNIPSKIKPPLAVILNLALSVFVGHIASPWIGSDLDAINRPFTTLSDYTGLISMRSLTILSYWLGGWDARQVTCLSILSLAPTLHYLHTYQPAHAPLVPTLTVGALIDLISIYPTFKFLRPEQNKRRDTTDSIRLFTALLASSIYQLCLHIASAKFLTTWLLGSGWDIDSVSRIYDSPEIVLLNKALMMLPIGLAISDLVFFAEKDDDSKTKDGEIARGLWGMFSRVWTRLGPRNKKIIKRTLVVAAYQTAGATTGASALKGGNLMGAAGMSSVWSVSTILVGFVLAWVGNIEG